MATGAVHSGGSGSAEQLETWLGRDDTDRGAREELDWLVAEARRDLAAADDRRRMTSLAAALSDWASDAEDELGAAALMHACQLAQDAGEAEEACAYAERALMRDPVDPAPMAVLDRLLTAAGDHARLESARITLVEQLEGRASFESALRVEALTALAVLRAGHLHDLDAAIHAYQEALEIDRQDAVLEALAELHLRRDQAGDADEAAELYFELADRADADRARSWLEQALDVQPDHAGALEALKQLSAGGDDDGRLVSRMVAFASVAPASEARDSVIEELKARNSDVSELEAATGDAPAAADAASPASTRRATSPGSARERAVERALAPAPVPGAAAAAGQLFAPAAASRTAIEEAVAASGQSSAVTSTLPYSRAVQARPAAGVAAHAFAPGSKDPQSAARAGGTLPFHTQTPSPAASEHAPAPARTKRGDSGRPAAKLPRSWMLWGGAVVLLSLVALASLGPEDEASPPQERTPRAEVESAPALVQPPASEPASETAQADEPAPADPEATAPEVPPAPAEPTADEDEAGEGDDVSEGEGQVAEAEEIDEGDEPGDVGEASDDDSPAGPEAPAALSRSIGGVMLPGALIRISGGTIPRDALYARLEPVQRKLARCYRTVRSRAPRSSGLLEYAWIVTPGGRAAKVRPLTGSTDTAALRLCGIRALRAGRFPPPEGGPAEVRAVFDFSPPAP